MTTNDDWQRFKAMMERAGWYQSTTMGHIFRRDPRFHCLCYDAFEGVTGRSDEKKRNSVGNWHEWLEAGQTPPPF